MSSPPHPLQSTAECFHWLQSNDPGAVSLLEHGSRMGYRMWWGGRLDPLRYWLGSLPLFQAHLSGPEGGEGTDLELSGIPFRGAIEAMWGQTICILDRRLLSSRGMLSPGRSQPLSCPSPKHCLCVSPVLGPPGWTCRSALTNAESLEQLCSLSSVHPLLLGTPP